MDNLGYIIELEGDKEFKKPQKLPEPTIPAHTFEDAITLAGVGKFHYFLMLICGICFMSVMVEIMGVGLILPSLKCDLESNLIEQGILTSAGFLGVVLSSHAMGFLADTCGRVHTLRFALLLAAISTIISAFSINMWMLIIFRFFTGFFISGGQACVFSLVGEFHGNKTRVKHVTRLSGFLPLALIYLPAISIFILPVQIDTVLWGIKLSSWRVLLLLNSFLALFAMFGLFAIPETPKYVLNQGNHDAALKILCWIFVKNTGRPVSEYPVKRLEMQSKGASLSNVSGVKDAAKMIWRQTVPLFYRERCLHTLNICCLMFFVNGISQGIFMWFPTVLNEMVAKDGFGYRTCEVITKMDTGTDLNGDICNGIVDIFPFVIIMMVGIAFFLVFCVVATSISFFSKKSVILTLVVITGISVVLIHWTANLYVNVALITLAMCLGNCTSLVCTISMEFFPTNINAMGMCFAMMIGRLGAFFGSNFMGTLLFKYCDDVYWGLMGLSVLMLLMGMCLPERKYQKPNASTT